MLLHAIESQADQPNQIALVPQPSSVVRRAGTFELTPGGPVRREQTGGGGPYCIGNEATFACLEGVLAEVIDLFPSRYIHVGGDEVEKTNWKKCPKCQARLCAEGLKDENELQSYFIRRIEKFLNARQRTLVGWDDFTRRLGTHLQRLKAQAVNYRQPRPTDGRADK